MHSALAFAMAMPLPTATAEPMSPADAIVFDALREENESLRAQLSELEAEKRQADSFLAEVGVVLTCRSQDKAKKVLVERGVQI